MIAAQAEVLGIPILQQETTWDTYEHEFKEAIAELKQKGVDGVVFGEIDIEDHKNWVVRVCSELEVIAILPLWGDEPHTLLNEFLQAGFEAIVVSAKAEFFGDEWLGKPVSQDFIGELSRLNEELNLHPCGEQGEYHTFVIDGPIFRRRIKIIDSHTVLREGYRFLDISRYELEGK